MGVLKNTENFKFSEFTKSTVAKSKNIINEPNAEQSQNISDVMVVMQHIRSEYGESITIESGFRCPLLNKAVKGSSTSAHLEGLACDFYPTNRNNMLKLQNLCLKLISESKIKVDQFIIEYPNKNGVASWLHLGIRHPKTGEIRGQILTIK